MSHSELFKSVIQARHLFAITNSNLEQGAIDCYLSIVSWVIKHYGQAGIVVFRGRFTNGGALDPNFIVFYQSLLNRK